MGCCPNGIAVTTAFCAALHDPIVIAAFAGGRAQRRAWEHCAPIACLIHIKLWNIQKCFRSRERSAGLAKM
jgi:hypothetical protein